MELEKHKNNKEVAQLFEKKIHIKSVRLFSKGSPTTKRVTVDTYDQVSKVVLKWFKRLRSKNVPVNVMLIKEKGLYFAK